MQDTYGELISSLAVANDKRIVLLVMDGLGDCDNGGAGTALQQARKPNLDALARRSAMGLLVPVATGVTPGSGPGHLGLFGYDPLVYQVGRGVLSALGVEFPLTEKDVAARLNFCTVDRAGKVADRRAGRISDSENRRVLGRIQAALKPPAGVEAFFQTESEHRAVLVLRGDGLDDNIGDTDPQHTAVEPLAANRPPHDRSRTAAMVAGLIEQVRRILADEKQATMILARGFAKVPSWPKFPDRYKLRAAAVAGYPMYRGVARLLGIPVVAQPTSAADVCRETARALAEHTFVFAHFKYTDKTGEDGDLPGKIARIEEMDAALPALLEARPDVLLITGDHSTPSVLKGHSWHPVPVLVWSRYVRPQVSSEGFGERMCSQGSLGRLRSRELLTVLLANGLRLAKFGA